MKTTILSQHDIQSVIADVGVDALMDQLISKLDEAFRNFDPKQTVVPLRDGFNYAQPRQGLLEWMPLLETGKHVLMKVVGFLPHQSETEDGSSQTDRVQSLATASVAAATVGGPGGSS